MPENRLGLREGGWGTIAVRFGLGLVGGIINALAILGAFGGAIAYAIRQQEGESQYSALIHIGYAAFNGFALYVLLMALADEDRGVLLTVVLWAVGTATAFFLYWNWVLG